MINDQFDIGTLKTIENKLDYIYSIAKSNYNDNPELMDTIENLALVAKMFAQSKIQDLNGHEKISSTQGFIVSKLGNSYFRMKTYEKQKVKDYPTWKL
jgi:hypothetical protein